MTTVDVIVPCYNYGRFLPDCIESILAQHDVRVRALIIDDASTDDSAAIARGLAARDDRVTLIEHQTNRGHIDTYNEGLDWAAADYLLLLSADDMLAPGALRRAVSVMEAHQDVGMVYGQALKFVGDDKPAAAPPVPDARPATIVAGGSFIEALCGKPTNPVETATAVVRTIVQKRVGGYRRQLPHAGDLEMWLRFAALGRVAFVDDVQAFTRIHGRNMRNLYAVDLMVGDYRQRSKAFEMFFAACTHLVPNARRLRRAVRRRLAEEILWAAAHAFEKGEPGSVPRLARLARSIYPQIVLEPLWAKVWLRRLIGLRGWRNFAPWLSRVGALRGAVDCSPR